MGESVPQNATAVSELAAAEHVGERLQAHLAEYEALRKEIEWLDQGARQYFNLGLLLIGAIATALPFVLDKAPQLIVPTLLTIPSFFSLLGFLYFREHEELFVIASYLREYVRPAIRQLLGDDQLWGWEEFKYARFRQVFGRGLSAVLSPVRAANLLRSLLFLLPSLIALVAVYGYAGQASFPFQITPNAVLNTMLNAWFAGDVLFTLLFLVKLLTQGNFARRILGMGVRSPSAGA